MNFTIPSAFKCFNVTNGAPGNDLAQRYGHSKRSGPPYHIPGLPRGALSGIRHCYGESATNTTDVLALHAGIYALLGR